MARPHIEFIQSQALPWAKGLYGGARPEVESKTLSLDDTNGESSMLLRYPAGWERHDEEYLLADEELFVLDGSLEIAGVEYGRHCYAHLPAGYRRASASSKEGAVVLTMFSGEPVAKSGTLGKGLHGDSNLVELKDTLEMPWEPLPDELGGSPDWDELPKNREEDDEMFFDAGMRYAARRKRLLMGTNIDEGSTLFAILPQTFPHNWTEKPVMHECVEECYLLAGELTGDRGVMYPGAYFWRPPGIYHGPYGTLTGWMHLGHLRYGDHENLRAAEASTFTFTPEHTPIMPPEYQEYADAYGIPPRTGTACF